jgi:hypothetical protein
VVASKLRLLAVYALWVDDYNTYHVATVGAQGAHKEHTTYQQGFILQDREHATYKEHQRVAAACRGLLDLEPVAGVWTLNVQPNCYSIHDNVDSVNAGRNAPHQPAGAWLAARSGAAQETGLWLPPRLPRPIHASRVCSFSLRLKYASTIHNGMRFWVYYVTRKLEAAALTPER